MVSALFSVLGESATTKAKSTVVKLYNNGSAADTALFPKCAVGERIDLLSYNFISRDCSIDSPCNVTLSATAEFLLHQKCSLQESCLNVTFPISDIRDKNVKGISIEYQCLGKQINLKSFKRNNDIPIDFYLNNDIQKQSVYYYLI